MVRVKPEPSTQGSQGASIPFLNTNPYILTSKHMHPRPSNLDPNSQNIKLNIQKHKPHPLNPNTLLSLARTTSGPHPYQPLTHTSK